MEGVGHFEPLRHYAEVHLKMEPGERGSGIVIGTDCSEDMLDKNWQRLILTHLLEKEHRGVLTGSVITDMKLTLTPRILSGNDVLTVEHLSKSFDSHKLFTDVNFEIKRGEHVAIIGDNGSGKTTLLKILNGLVPADQGTFRLGSNVEIGYYDQEHHVLHNEKTIFGSINNFVCNNWVIATA